MGLQPVHLDETFLISLVYFAESELDDSGSDRSYNVDSSANSDSPTNADSPIIFKPKVSEKGCNFLLIKYSVEVRCTAGGSSQVETSHS